MEMSRGRFAVMLESFCRREPAAAFRGLANGSSPSASSARFSFSKAAGNRLDRPQVLRDVLSHAAIAAGGPAGEQSLLVDEGHAEAIHLRLAHVGEGLAREGALQAGLELADLVGVIGVVQAEHGDAVLDRGEALRHGAADALRGG